MRGGRVLRGLGAAVVAVLALAAVGALVAAGMWWPVPAREPAPPIAVPVGAATLDLVCAGPLKAASSDADLAYDPAFDPSPAGTSTTATLITLGRGDAPAAAGEYLDALAPEAASRTPLEPSGAAASAAVVGSSTGPGVLRAAPVEGTTALVAGASIARTDAGDLRGLAGAACQEPAASAWIVGGATELGSSARLVIDNPGQTPATVRIEAWGPAGPLDAGQAGTVLVPPGEERAVLIEAFAAEQSRIAVHLTATGGRVAAWLQDSALRGFTPAGTDLIAPAAEPSTSVVVPGLVLPETQIDAEDPAVLRILNPNSETTTASLRLLGADGVTSIPGAEEIALEPGTVTDVSLAGVPEGSYAADLSADLPVTASAMLTRIGSPLPDEPDQPVVDRAWSTGASGAPSLLLALPGVGAQVSEAVVLLTNPGAGAVTAATRPVYDGGRVGETVGLRVPAGATVSVPADVLDGALAVAVAVAVAQEAGDRPAVEGGPQGVVAVAVLTTEAQDGVLITVLGAQSDTASEQAVAVRLVG